ncbi:MAG: START domain-containing protein [Bdellovibrionota bacterium]
MRPAFYFTFLSILTHTAWASPTPPGELWEKIDDRDGIQVFQKVNKYSSLVAFRCEGVIESTLDRVATAVANPHMEPQKGVDSRTIRRISTYERIEYQHAKMPWPFQDRDFVFRAMVDLDKAERKISINFESIEDPAMPEQPGRVRGEIRHSVYELKSVEGGTKTAVALEVEVDPRGNIPKWIVNLNQKDWPRKALEKLKARAAKTDLQVDDDIRRILTEPGPTQPQRVAASQ